MERETGPNNYGPQLPSIFLNTPLAHRGLHHISTDIVENSISAANAAIEHGFGIEIDVQLSRDGIAVVFHDNELSRLTKEEGRVQNIDAKDLCTIALLGSAEDRIPSLSELLSVVGGRVPVLIELKDQSGCFGDEPDTLARSVSDTLKDYHGPVAAMSFNPHSVAHLAHHAPETPRGLTTQRFRPRRGLSLARAAELSAIRKFDEVGASFISHDRRSLRAAAVIALRKRGVPILTWTVKTQRQEEKARRIAHNVTFEGYIATGSAETA
ncbi:MAG: glycerophosphodiester phosphodiesterase family protein [Pseudomonadota bacterium]